MDWPSKYPLGLLIQERRRALGLSRAELVRRIGYRNPSSGCRSLDRLLEEGVMTPFLLEGLPRALELPEEVVGAAVRATADMLRLEEEEEEARLEAAERAAFRPHLFVVTERRVPTQIFICGVVGGMSQKFAELPDGIRQHGPEGECRIIRDTIRLHLEKTGGKTWFFGRITGFVYFRDFDEPPLERLCFDTAGTLTTDFAPPRSEPTMESRLRGKGVNILPALRRRWLEQNSPPEEGAPRASARPPAPRVH